MILQESASKVLILFGTQPSYPCNDLSSFSLSLPLFLIQIKTTNKERYQIINNKLDNFKQIFLVVL